MRLVEIDSPTYGERQMADYVMERCAPLVCLCGRRRRRQNRRHYRQHLRPDARMTHPASDVLRPPRHGGAITGQRAVLPLTAALQARGHRLKADDLTAVAAILEALTVLSEGRLRHGPIEALLPWQRKSIWGSRVFDFSKVLSEQAYVLDLAGPVGTAASRCAQHRDLYRHRPGWGGPRGV